MTVSRARTIVPASGSWSPVMSSRSVVFPAPFGPTTAMRRPAAMSRPTSLKRCCAPWLFATEEMVTRLMVRSVRQEARAAGVESEPRGHARDAGRVPGLLDRMRGRRLVADREHRRAGPGEAGAGRPSVVRHLDQLTGAG